MLHASSYADQAIYGSNAHGHAELSAARCFVTVSRSACKSVACHCQRLLLRHTHSFNHTELVPQRPGTGTWKAPINSKPSDPNHAHSACLDSKPSMVLAKSSFVCPAALELSCPGRLYANLSMVVLPCGRPFSCTSTPTSIAAECLFPDQESSLLTPLGNPQCTICKALLLTTEQRRWLEAKGGKKKSWASKNQGLLQHESSLSLGRGQSDFSRSNEEGSGMLGEAEPADYAEPDRYDMLQAHPPSSWKALKQRPHCT